MELKIKKIETPNEGNSDGFDVYIKVNGKEKTYGFSRNEKWEFDKDKENPHWLEHIKQREKKLAKSKDKDYSKSKELEGETMEV